MPGDDGKGFTHDKGLSKRPDPDSEEEGFNPSMNKATLGGDEKDPDKDEGGFEHSRGLSNTDVNPK